MVNKDNQPKITDPRWSPKIFELCNVWSLPLCTFTLCMRVELYYSVHKFDKFHEILPKVYKIKSVLEITEMP